MIFMCPYANTIAFGGVATGSMKANDVAIVVDSVRYNGFTSSTTAYVKVISNLEQ